MSPFFSYDVSTDPGREGVQFLCGIRRIEMVVWVSSKAPCVLEVPRMESHTGQTLPASIHFAWDTLLPYHHGLM